MEVSEGFCGDGLLIWKELSRKVKIGRRCDKCPSLLCPVTRFPFWMLARYRYPQLLVGLFGADTKGVVQFLDAEQTRPVGFVRALMGPIFQRIGGVWRVV